MCLPFFWARLCCVWRQGKRWKMLINFHLFLFDLMVYTSNKILLFNKNLIMVHWFLFHTGRSFFKGFYFFIFLWIDHRRVGSFNL
uniref:Uncharacterized protein n=1 Tax=Cannabis sativa TaxID=3483 RepID=A0A803R460_CANSA